MMESHQLQPGRVKRLGFGFGFDFVFGRQDVFHHRLRCERSAPPPPTPPQELAQRDAIGIGYTTPESRTAQ